MELAAATRRLQQEILRRQAVEESLKTSQQHYRQLLERSRLMQEQLRHLSRQILLAQEQERKEISRELRPTLLDDLGVDSRPPFLHEGVYKADGSPSSLYGLCRG